MYVRSSISVEVLLEAGAASGSAPVEAATSPGKLVERQYLEEMYEDLTEVCFSLQTCSANKSSTCVQSAFLFLF